MPIAYNGNVDGVQLWIPDHHWWDSPSIWRLPKRPEDGELDWSRLFQHQRDIIRRFTATLRSLCGLSTTLPTVPFQPFGKPSPKGWVMPIGTDTNGILTCNNRTYHGSIRSHHPITGTSTFALLVDIPPCEPWFIVRADGYGWHTNPRACNTRVTSIWVDVLVWRHTSQFVLPMSEITMPPEVSKASFRTIYPDRYPDDSQLYGTAPLISLPPDERIEVTSVPTWWQDRLLWQQVLTPAASDPDSYRAATKSIDERLAYECLTHYAHLVRDWTSPYAPSPRMIEHSHRRQDNR